MVTDQEQSSTYSAITRLRDALPKHSLVQYTATPQAILLTNRDDHYNPEWVRFVTPGEKYIGTKEIFNEIKYVRSHAQAIGQCQKIINKKKFQPIISADTAGSAKDLAEGKLEVDDPIGDLTYQSLRLIPDLRDSGIGQYSDLFGWLTRGWSFGEFRHHFASGLGVSAVDEEYSQLIFDVSYQRSSWSAFWTLIQPLVVVMASIVLITRVLTEFRVEIPIAVLLTLIFLQDGYRSELPNLPYLSFLDSVYAIAYLLSIVSFALVLYLESLKRRASLEQSGRRGLILERIRLYEQSWPAVSLLVMVLLSAASWLLI